MKIEMDENTHFVVGIILVLLTFLLVVLLMSSYATTKREHLIEIIKAGHDPIKAKCVVYNECSILTTTILPMDIK